MKDRPKVDFESCFIRYSRIFNILGESCVASLKSLSILKRQYSSCISLFITIFSTIMVVVFEWWNFKSTPRLTNAIYAIFFGSIISTKLIGITKMWTLSSNLPNLFTQFKDLNAMTESKWDLRNFQECFHRENAIVFGVWLITCALNASIYYDHSLHTLATFCVALVVLINRITMCHVRFYVELLNDFIDFFICYTKRKIAKTKSMHDIRMEFIIFKIIHFKLYEISKTVNAIFGWILVSIFAHEFFDLVYQIYWIFLLLDCSNTYIVIRN